MGFAHTPFVLFENSADRLVGSAVLLQQPIELIVASEPDQIGSALTRLQLALDEGLQAAGFFSYELGYALESSLQALMPLEHRLPLIWFGLFKASETVSVEQLSSFLASDSDVLSGPSGLFQIQPNMTCETYLHLFEQVTKLISAGDLYQLNLTFPVSLTHRGSAAEIYASLRALQPVSTGCFLQAVDFSVLSLSPELFFEIQDGEIFTRPMKGTIRRGETPQEDEALKLQLALDEKNRAENLMIVDLMRNDFSRICQQGSVEVTDLFSIEKHPTLFQMTSGVKGRLCASVDIEMLLKALFPAGSITGAPKMRAMEAIRTLERQPRGVYTGAIGWFRRDEKGKLRARFNVAIRTLTLWPDGSGEAAVGSGIVADSIGEEEYRECQLKYKFLQSPDYQLIETMLLRPDGRYDLLERHLQRMRRSAEALGFLFPENEVRESLLKLVDDYRDGFARVRLLLASTGTFSITPVPIDPPDPAATVFIVISDQRVDSTDRLLAHKTTRRQFYDDEWTRWNRSCGADEVIFLNEHGELTEGSRSNLFVGRGECLVTPSLSCGLLPGTLREELLAKGRAREGKLNLSDLVGSEIYVGNSVRGLQRARLFDETSQ